MPPMAVLCSLERKLWCDSVAKWIGDELGRRGRRGGTPARFGSAHADAAFDHAAFALLKSAGHVELGYEAGVICTHGTCRSGDGAEGQKQGDEECFLHVMGSSS